MNSCKDYSMITDWSASQISFAKIAETISKTTAVSLFLSL